MKNLLAGVIALGLLAFAQPAEAQWSCGCGSTQRIYESYSHASWQCSPTRCWTDSTYCSPCQCATTRCWADSTYSSPCQSRVYERCHPCYEQTTTVESDGLQADVNRLKDQVQNLKARVLVLEKKLAPSDKL